MKIKHLKFWNPPFYIENGNSYINNAKHFSEIYFPAELIQINLIKIRWTKTFHIHVQKAETPISERSEN
jgi:hypothetical protein